MAWDWEKLNQQQQQNKGGPPPQVDEFLKQLKNLKIPGGMFLVLLVILAIVLAAAASAWC